MKLKDLYQLKGTITSRSYFLWGFLLVAIKYNIDRFVSWSFFNTHWLPTDYFFPSVHTPITSLSNNDVTLILTLIALSLPFIWAGVVLTLKRLRDAGLPEYLTATFFIPFVNLLLFALLSVLPTKVDSPDPKQAPKARNLSRLLQRLIPHDKFGSALLGIFIAAALGLALVGFSANTFEIYGLGLFIGAPFMMGLCSTLVFAFHHQRTFSECISVATSSIVVLGLLLLAVAIEGIICIAMATPVGLMNAWFGAFIGYIIQRAVPRPSQTGTTILVLPLILPFILMVESKNVKAPELRTAITSITINAPQSVVWNNVVTFSELPPPSDWIFNTGIAYPLRARIEGTGVGAIRYCEFSTGPFVEPIEVWDAPNLLRFSVVKTPPPMQEWSPYAELKPTHLEGFFLSRGGQFKLSKLENGRTLLEGTTWYENRIWPRWYWSWFSERILSRIHTRVLKHIKQQSEEGL